MAAHAVFKGNIKIGLVSFAMRAYAACNPANEGIQFNLLHRDCMTKINKDTVCRKCDKVLGSGDTVRGYEHTKGQFVVMEDEELAGIKVESNRLIDIETVIPEGSIDPIFYERTYYVGPDGPVSLDAFATMRDALAGFMGIGKIAMYGREFMTALRPFGPGFMLHTLKTASEIRSMDGFADMDSVPAKAPEAHVRMAKMLVDNLRGTFDPSEFLDRYREAVLARLKAKIAGEEYVTSDTAAPTSTTSHGLMDQLAASLNLPKKQKAAPKQEEAKPKRKKGKVA